MEKAALPVVRNWGPQEWIDQIKRGSNKPFEYCLHSMGSILCMRALHGHSGGNRVDPTLQNNVEIPCGWVDEHIHHVGSAFHCKSIIEAGLSVGGKVKVKVDKSCLLTAIFLSAS